MKPDEHEVKLSPKEFTDIWGEAHRLYIQKAATYKNSQYFLCMCFAEAFLQHCKGKNYLISKGKIFKNEDK